MAKRINEALWKRFWSEVAKEFGLEDTLKRYRNYISRWARKSKGWSVIESDLESSALVFDRSSRKTKRVK